MHDLDDLNGHNASVDAHLLSELEKRASRDDAALKADEALAGHTAQRPRARACHSTAARGLQRGAVTPNAGGVTAAVERLQEAALGYRARSHGDGVKPEGKEASSMTRSPATPEIQREIPARPWHPDL